jgi:hypothetical protein
VEIRHFYFWSFDRMRVRMTAVSLKNSKADRSDDSGERSGAGGIGRGDQQWQKQYAPVQGSLNPNQIHDLLSICATMSVVRSA